MVPRSFSRTTDSAVETTAVIIAMNAMSPGTRKSVLRSCGLYQMRGSSVSGARAPVARVASSRIAVEISATMAWA